MAIQVKYPYEIRCYGRFKSCSKELFAFWNSLEDLAKKEWFIGMYSATDVLQFGINKGVVNKSDAAMVLDALGHDVTERETLINELFYLQDKRKCDKD